MDFTSEVGNYQSVENLARARFGMDKSATVARKAVGESVDINKGQDIAAASELEQKKARLKELEQAQKDMADPKKYQKVRNPDTGGFDFFNPLGEKVTLTDYANATNLRRDDILKDSMDIRDMQFLQEHFDLEDYMNIKVKSTSGAIAPEDQEFIDLVESNNPELKDIPLGDIIKKFRGRYKQYYDSNAPDEDVSRFFVDLEPQKPEDTRSNIQKVKDLFNPFQ